jgi:plastocyanin
LKKHLVLTVAAVAVMLVSFGPGLASAESLVPAAKIYMTEDKGALKFLAPTSVYQGDELTVVNETDPKKVGPHTFSLVTQATLPKTPKARKSCFTPKHICMSIAKWHGFDPKTERITINPVEAGPEGWSTMGNNSGKEGDSWFTGEKKAGTSYSQQVTAEPGTLYFICAIHPWMQGKTKVLPAPVLPLGS